MESFKNSRYEYTTSEFATESISGDPATEAEMKAGGWTRAWAEITTDGTFAVYRRNRPAPASSRRWEGYHDESSLPIKQGQEVTILKGTRIRTTHPRDFNNGGIRTAGRTYKVVVNHLMPGMTTPVQKTNPSVCWPGEGQYWFGVDLNDIPEAQQG